MDTEERISRLVGAAVQESLAASAIRAALECLVAVPMRNRESINKSADAAMLALRALRTTLAMEIGRIRLGDAELEPDHD